MLRLKQAAAGSPQGSIVGLRLVVSPEAVREPVILTGRLSNFSDRTPLALQINFLDFTEDLFEN